MVGDDDIIGHTGSDIQSRIQESDTPSRIRGGRGSRIHKEQDSLIRKRPDSRISSSVQYFVDRIRERIKSNTEKIGTVEKRGENSDTLANLVRKTADSDANSDDFRNRFNNKNGDRYDNPNKRILKQKLSPLELAQLCAGRAHNLLQIMGRGRARS